MSPLPHDHQTQVPGKVDLVGAGPGAADLITIRGKDCLAQAEVVLYDYLANPELLSWVPENAEKICLGKHGSGRLWNQEQINRTLVDRAQQGKRVVRLKGGDPSIFGCAAQEVAALAEHGIDFTIVPGITAGIAAAGSAGIPITHREFASAVAFVTGREDHDKTESSLDYAALAKFPGTLIFYMGTTTVAAWSGGLISAGLSHETPVVIIRRATHQDQTVHTTTLGAVTQTVQSQPPLRPPVIFIIGRAADSALRYPQSHNESHPPAFPLANQTVWITRPLERSAALSESLKRLGANTKIQPAIEIVRLPTDVMVSERFAAPLKYDWMVFSSINGVDAFFDLLLEQGKDLRAIASTKIAAVGQGTARALRSRGLIVDCVPHRFDAETLAEALIQAARTSPSQSPATPQRHPSALLVRGETGRPILSQRLEAADWEVSEAVVYRSVPLTNFDPQTCEQLSQGVFRWTTVTSPAVANGLYQAMGDRLKRTRLISISPLTSQTIRELGFDVAAEADEASDQGLLRAILDDANQLDLRQPDQR